MGALWEIEALLLALLELQAWGMAATLVSPDQAPGEGFLIVKVEDSWEQDCAPEVAGEAETYRQRFRHFCYPMEAGPHAALSQLWELCCLWLRPELRSKEQILEQLVLDQFLSALPEELQARVRERQPKSGEEAVALVEELQKRPQVWAMGCWAGLNCGPAVLWCS